MVGDPVEKVPYCLEQNGDGSWAIIENPTSKLHGSVPWLGDQVVRSPFKTADEARQRMKDIAEHWQYESYEIAPPEEGATYKK
jgi:hypothetical protein